MKVNLLNKRIVAFIIDFLIIAGMQGGMVTILFISHLRDGKLKDINQFHKANSGRLSNQAG